jgi:uncharacterized protein YacL
VIDVFHVLGPLQVRVVEVSPSLGVDERVSPREGLAIVPVPAVVSTLVSAVVSTLVSAVVSALVSAVVSTVVSALVSAVVSAVVSALVSAMVSAVVSALAVPGRRVARHNAATRRDPGRVSCS